MLPYVYVSMAPIQIQLTRRNVLRSLKRTGLHAVTQLVTAISSLLLLTTPDLTFA
jgi:hypothetical protein